MPFPAPLLEIAYEDPADEPNWIVETARLRTFDVDRGRATELDRTEAGRMTVRLDGRDRRYDPTYVAGPYYPNVRPARRIRLRASIDSGQTAFGMKSSSLKGGDVLKGGVYEYPIFVGFVESWEQEWDRDTSDVVAVVTAVDGFKVLALADFAWGQRYTGAGNPEDFVCGFPSGTNVVPDTGPPFVPDDLSGTRIGRVLDCIGWPGADRDVDDGDWLILGSSDIFGGSTNVKVDGKALSHLQDVANTEGGLLFVAADGRLTFRAQSNDPAPDAQDIWGELAGEQPYRDISGPLDDSRLWNDVTVNATNPSIVASFQRADQPSVDRHYQRSAEFTILPSALQADGTAGTGYRVDDYLAFYKEPRIRFPTLDLVPTTGAQWIEVLRRDLFRKVYVRRRPDVGPALDNPERIEGIVVRGDARNPRDWRYSWNLSGVLLNMLTGDDESLEGGLGSWAASVNCSVAQSTAAARKGIASLQMTATAGGDMRASLPTGTSGKPVTAGAYYTFRGFARTAVMSRVCRAYLAWYTSGGAFVSEEAGAVAPSDSTANWLRAEVQAKAPATAAFATPIVEVVAAAASEVHRWDWLQLYPGIV